MAHVTLILGGARSGKSRYAQQRAEASAEASGVSLVYLATATAGDGEMADRIRQHQADRGPQWRTLEEPLALEAVIRDHARAGQCLLVDCLTLWLTNLMMAEQDSVAATEELIAALNASEGEVLLVSNEVGQGIVPINPMARQFCDDAGRMHQRIAAMADEVWFVTVGLPQRLK